MIDEMVVRNLSFNCRTYDDLCKMLISTKNRLGSMNPGASEKHQDLIKNLESIKGKMSRNIEKDLEFYPVWTEWLKHVPGAGPFIAGNLVLLYYYRFTPVCEKCGTKLEKKAVEEKGKSFNTFWCSTCQNSPKGEGHTKHAIAEKDFPNISGWWHYMGRHVIDGKMPKRKKGIVSDWSSRGRVVTYHFSDQVNRHKEDEPYKAFMLSVVKKRLRTHPKATKGHRLNMAKHETAKLFLSHFWTVARTLAGKPVSEPYAGTILGHTGIIAPFYFKQAVEVEVAAA